MHNIHRPALCALLISLVAQVSSAQVYRITDLGPLSPTANKHMGPNSGQSQWPCVHLDDKPRPAGLRNVVWRDIK